ncbi:MAG TPA: carboxypeptidase-like regulatory domain-containing protein, partial [Pyrinomonadaceae bacterium]
MNLGRQSIGILALLSVLILAALWFLRPQETSTTPAPAALATRSTALSSSDATMRDRKDVTPDPPTAFATFRGRVIDAATRAPVREFELRFAERGGTSAAERVPEPKRFHTADGRFEWQQLPAGRWSLIARANGYQLFLVASVDLVVGQATPELIVPLTRGHVLRGRIYDDLSNTGIASASITFHESGRPRYEGNFLLRPAARSQSDGTFLLDGIPSGLATLEVAATNYAGRSIDVVVEDAVEPIEIGLSVGAAISGRLTAADGVTAASGLVALVRLGRNSLGRDAHTGNSGEFSFRSLTPGNYRLSGRGPAGTATRDFVISASEQIEDVTLSLRAG